MGTWNNDDGLYVRYGTDESAVVDAGMFSSNQEDQVVTVFVDALKLNAHDASDPTTVLSWNFKVPKENYMLVAAEFKVTEAFAGDTATLDFGLHDTDGTTEWDDNGIDAAIAVTAIDAVGDTIACDGALIGTILSNSTPGYITAEANTATFTAGKGRLTLRLRPVPATEA